MKYHITPFFNWFKKEKIDKPWLVVGKGPSFDQINKVSLDDYSVIGLNHVMFKIPCLIGHAIDLDVYELPCREFLCKHLLTPWEPHINFKPGGYSLIDLMLDSRLGYNDLLYYDSSRTTKDDLKMGGPTVRVRHFGSVAVMNILAMAGVKEIFTVGIDGGNKYSHSFDKKNLLANGRASFDSQFLEFDDTTKRYGTTITPLF